MLIPMISALLIILSSLIWVAMNSNILSYQSIAIAQQSTQQFLITEYALAQAQHWLQHTPQQQLPKPVDDCLQQPCIRIAQAAAYLPQQSASWWQAANNANVTQVNMPIPSEHQAFYVIEELITAQTQDERYFRITSWALLSTYAIPSVLQSVWIKSSVGTNGKASAWRQWQ